jgi:D-amino peptidase
MKIYIMTDLEGVAGVIDWEDRKDESAPNIIKRQRYARLLAGEVNAAVEGCFSAGATEVLVEDAHGSGYTIDYELLDPRAKVFHGYKRNRIMPSLDASFDAMLMVGAHAMARTKGAVLYHTMSADTREIRLNGKPVGEFAIFAFIAGAFGVPTLMITGDTAACREGRKLIPGLVAVEVKKGFTRYSAESLSKEAARDAITEGTVRALSLVSKINPFTLRPPFTYQDDTFTGNDTECKSSHPDDLPKKWTVNPLIRAKTARELIKKVWTYKA